MALLIVEHLDTKLETIEEATETGKKNLYLTGPFMMYNEGNRNKRVYTEQVMAKELKRYCDEVVSAGKAYGELNHPESRQIDLNNVCHVIQELRMESDNHVYGKSIVPNTPPGLTVKGLIEVGANLGVSSRGLGSLKEGRNGLMEVQDDFHLITAADVVADPSAPKAFVKGIMEGVEFFYDDRLGDYVQMKIEDLKKEVHKTPIKRLDEEKMLDLFETFLHVIKAQPKKEKVDPFKERLERFNNNLKKGV